MFVMKSHGSLFRYISVLTIFILFSFTVNFQVKAETGEEYTVIDRKDLVPASWRRPMIDSDPPEPSMLMKNHWHLSWINKI